MNHRRKVTKEVERELVEIYLTQGRAVAAKACVEHGVSPHYAVNAAAALGKGRPRWRAGTKYKGKRPAGKPPTITRSESDHRWQWAIERGAVVA